MSMFTWDQLTPPTDTMRILLHMVTPLHMGITAIRHMGTTHTKNYTTIILQERQEALKVTLRMPMVMLAR